MEHDDIVNDILRNTPRDGGGRAGEIADLRDRVRVMNLEFAESLDTMNVGTKKLLNEYLIRAEKKLNEIYEQTVYNEIVLRHLLNVMLLDPSSSDHQKAWADAKPTFTDFLKKGMKQ